MSRRQRLGGLIHQLKEHNMTYPRQADSREFSYDHVRTIAAQQERQAELDRLKAEFFRRGNKITTIPGFVSKPIPLPRYIGTGSRQEIARRRAERELDQRAASIIRRYHCRGMKVVREALHEAGIGMPPKRVELIAARYGILIAESARCESPPAA